MLTGGPGHGLGFCRRTRNPPSAWFCMRGAWFLACKTLGDVEPSDACHLKSQKFAGNEGWRDRWLECWLLPAWQCRGRPTRHLTCCFYCIIYIHLSIHPSFVYLGCNPASRSTVCLFMFVCRRVLCLSEPVSLSTTGLYTASLKL